MALIDRVKERVETDLLDPELQNLIDEANQEIIDTWGPVGSAVTVTLEGRERRKLDIARPIDSAQPITITEYLSEYGFGETTTVLAANDHRLWNNGRTIERRADGTNPRLRWGSRVDVQYVPQNDTKQRDEVVIKLVQLAVEYEGVAKRSVGDVRTEHVGAGLDGGIVYTREREKLIASLNPRKGLLFA